MNRLFAFFIVMSLSMKMFAQVSLDDINKMAVVDDARLFYEPNSSAITERSLSKSDLNRLQTQAADVLAVVLALHDKYREKTEKFVGKPLGAKPRVKLQLLDLVNKAPLKPYARSYHVDGAPGVIDLNAALVRILLQNAAIEAAKQHPPPRHGGTLEYLDSDTSKSCTTDVTCFALYLSFVNDLHANNLKREDAIAAWMFTSQVQTRFLGTLFFVLAHEVGHLLFEHSKCPCDAPSCAVFQGNEKEADRFAAYLVTLNLGATDSLAIGLGLDQYTGETNYIGFPLFFEVAYPRLGLDDPNLQSLCACDYPPADERNGAASAAARRALPDSQDVMMANAFVGFDEELKRLKKKYPGTTSSALITDMVNGPAPLLLPYEERKKWGYMTAGGDVVIKPRFEGAEIFRDGFAVVNLSKNFREPKRIFIDRLGKERFKAELGENSAFNKKTLGQTRIGSFHFGRAMFETATASGVRHFGFFDQNGRPVISPDYSSAEDFQEGVAAVMLSNPKDFMGSLYGFIKPDGSFLIDPKYEFARSFSEGLAAVEVQGMNTWGYVNQAGVFVISPQFEAAWNFGNGRALVQRDGKRFLIDNSGEQIAGDFITALPFSMGLAAANFGGTIEDLYFSSQGQQYTKDGMWGYITPDGKIKIPPNFTCARSFSDGLAAVRVNGKVDYLCEGGQWGFITPDGQWKIEPRFSDIITDFHDGVARVETAKGEAWINKDGAAVEPRH